MLQPRFDAGRDTPALIDAVAAQCPPIREVMSSLRSSLPLAPHSRPGSMGSFLRIPNHYRSVSVVLASDNAVNPVAGVVVFKGTEPLLPDFAEYVDWMLRAPFRASYLPLGLHYPLDMKLPPAAMWIEECVLEQEIASAIQLDYFRHYGRLARLPVPLFVYELTSAHVQRYEAIVRARLSAAAFKRIEAKVADGLGIEVYYYPTLPVRAADLYVPDVKAAFRSDLRADVLDGTFNNWIRLLAEMLHLGYMPFAPWNHGMGACVDPGNACIDGGFHDLLTLVPFTSIPNEHLFWRSLSTSIQMLASTVIAMSSVASDVKSSSQSDPIGVALAYVMERLRAHIRSDRCNRHPVDSRLLRFFDAPSVEDVFRHLRETHRDGTPAQFGASPGPATEPATLEDVVGESHVAV